MQLKLLMLAFVVVWFNFSMKGIYINIVSFTKQEAISLKTNDDAQCSQEENNI